MAPGSTIAFGVVGLLTSIFSAPARDCMTRPARTPPWTTQTSRASAAVEEQWDEAPWDEEPWDTVMEQEQGEDGSSDL